MFKSHDFTRKYLVISSICSTFATVNQLVILKDESKVE